MCYQVLDYFHFVLYKILQYMLKKFAYLLKYWFFDSPLNLISDSPLNFSPEKLCHTIWFLISKIDIFCWVWENNQYGTLNAVIYKSECLSKRKKKIKVNCGIDLLAAFGKSLSNRYYMDWVTLFRKALLFLVVLSFGVPHNWVWFYWITYN